MKRFLLPCLMVASLSLCIVMPASSAGKGKKRQDLPGERVTEHGRIDWDKGVLYASGLGAISNKESNEAKAYLRARTFAKLDALRNLLMVVDHVRIDSHTVGADYEAASDVIRAEVHGIVRGAQVISERRIPVGSSTMVEVTVATPMYGDQGIASVFVPEMLRRNHAQEHEQGTDRSDEMDKPAPTPDEPSDSQEPLRVEPLDGGDAGRDSHIRAPIRPLRQPDEQTPNEEVQVIGGRHTSLIVDARGLGLWRSMSPKIRRADGSELWGTVNVDPNYVIEHGIVVYAHTLDQARRDARAGTNPLIVRAVSRGGGPFPSDPYISDRDAERVMEADSRTGFLGKFRVIFVVDTDR